MAKLRK